MHPNTDDTNNADNTNNGAAILVEDEQAVRRATAQTLELGGFSVSAWASAEEALPLLTRDFNGILVTDVRLPGMSGLALLEHAVGVDADIPVIVVTGHGDIGTAVDAMRAGAYDFIEKPFASDRLLEVAARAQEKRRLVLENRKLREAWARHPELPPLVGQSPAIERVRTLIGSLGPADVDVLINGQTGTGKEVVARQLHAASGRKGPFVALNCGALPESVFESEIFGHEAGAFTGAQKRRIGKLEYANGGTLFLDEIESMPLAMQVKLLRVLQERRLERLGGNESVTIDCRVVAASKADLLQMSARGEFREDLYYRIGVVAIDLPTLNQRGSDIPLLLAHFCQAAAVRYRRDVPPWSAAQMQQWQQREWPGNVRELRNFADRWVLGVSEAGPEREAPPEGISLPQQVENFEAGMIAFALRETGGSVALAAQHLGIPKKTLYDKIKKYNLGEA
ncbi:MULTISPECIES: sigma-54 dependent transcriptional regulator [unclassified Herbaspirillum]|uniref:sigma-54-dependent transcriptional regulator n=1 Tax=unclassified Herbaspirillum TaxID=2624150 RepID=UPI001152C649|nr:MULTISPECIES: sigma-54 dependent transcriptional regulator [unclassified Herbaspirillum]MBB5391136.1 two-component system C4-dicarboxylate transport response regulator DctD [Herbaspirillum sp. SJZ102]TQK13173.1 two-component system C4-dicarboxylate transport response regulator DctD [Herbaspirillum sp. SJZ130]TQK15177.1 two-component system C4-dicarboxylate transport response regulator DctD [Herbaspirillum sp. SJZ106]